MLTSAHVSHSIYLDSYLAPLARFLEPSDVTDIYVNRPGEIWVEALGKDPERHVVPELTREVLARLVRQIAASSAQGISRENPLLSASLPSGERVQAAISPATRGELALAIRKHVSAGMQLEDYEIGGAFAQTRALDGTALVKKPVAKARDGKFIALLRHAVLNRRNILVSGGTSSGKTTFVNALLREIPAHERLITIEDTPELHLQHENSVSLIAARGATGEADIDAEDLLIASLRMRPDRIILGEIRGREATTFLRAVNTGHPGSITTIHADSPARAIDQLALLVLQSGTNMDWNSVVRYVKASIDIIVQLRRTGGRRDVESVLVVE